MGLFKKLTEIERKEKAQRIMIESGWYKKYYYILKVIRSCEKTTTYSLCVMKESGEWIFLEENMMLFLSLIKHKK